MLITVKKTHPEVSVIVSFHSMASPTRVLSLMAHPDDAEIFCGGTLALLRQTGCEIHIASMTPGDCGSMTHSASEIAAIRRREGARGAAKLGGAYHCLDRRDLLICYDEPTVQAAVELIRQIDPQIVFSHPPHDYMPDHEVTSLVARTACFAAPAVNFDTGERPAAPGTPAIPHLYYSSPAGGADIFGQPAEFSTFVDVGAFMELKAEALCCHESQREWLRTQHGMDHYVDEMRRWASDLGKRAGVDFAEGFRQHIGHPYPANDLLRETLG